MRANPEELAAGIVAVVEPRPEIQEAYLFGSTARRDAGRHSDVDVAVFIDPEAVGELAFGYQATLTAGLMSGIRTDRVDVLVLNDATPLIYHRVLRDGIRVFSRDLRATTRREGRALSRYCDFAPQLAKIEAAL